MAWYVLHIVPATASPTPSDDHATPTPFALADFERTKLQVPRANHAIAGHDRFLALRPAPAQSPVVTVLAPAGYGKSTLITEWAEHDSGRLFWLSLDEHDDDPAALVGYLCASLLESGVDAPGLYEALRDPAASVWTMLMPRLSAELQGAAPFTLMLDDVHKVASRESWDIIDWLALHVPQGAQVILAGRSVEGSAVPRLRVDRLLTSRTQHDLALRDAEAFELLANMDLKKTMAEASRLNDLCHGWVSGILMSAAAPDPATGIASSSADLIDSYIDAEVMRDLRPEDQEFLTLVSVLRTVSPQLCDAVLQREDSAELLHRLCAANAFVSQVGGGWCHLHELIRTALLVRLEQRGPEYVASLRGRAAVWHAEQGNAVEAVHYSMEAGRPDQTVDLIGRFAVQMFSSGRSTMLARWVDWLESSELTDGRQSALTAAAIATALSGDPERSQRMAAVARRSGRRQAPAERDPAEQGCRALTDAWQCQRGAQAMLTDATRAVELLPEEGPWFGSALGAFGYAQLMNGLRAEGAATFQDFEDRPTATIPDTNARAVAKVVLATFAMEEQQLDRAVDLLQGSAAIRAEYGITELGLSALDDAVATRVALIRGTGIDEARRSLTHAQRVRQQVTWAIPALAMHVRLELVKAHLSLGDVAGARTIMREISDILHRRPGLGAFEIEATELRQRLEGQAETQQGPSTLTSAELRLVPWLATHLSFREIGERLFLSPNTVKTEALSTYRKLGASSRSEAVELAVQVGLLDSASLAGILGAEARRAKSAG